MYRQPNTPRTVRRTIERSRQDVALGESPLQIVHAPPLLRLNWACALHKTIKTATFLNSLTFKSYTHPKDLVAYAT